MSKPSLLTRLGLAWDSFKSADVMHFPRSSYMGGGGIRAAGGFTSWADDFLRRYPGTNIRYEREVGNLTLSSLVMAPVQYLGRRLPEAPAKVYDIDAEGQPNEVVDHPVTQLLKRPNPFYSGKTLAKIMSLNWMIDGNIFLLKVRNARGVPIQLWPLPYWMVAPRWNEGDDTSFIDYYEYRVNQDVVQYAREDIIHLRDGADPENDRRGLSPLKSLLREVYTDNEISNMSAQLMRNGGIPDFILSPASGSLNEKDALFLREEFQRRRTGDERGKAIMATAGIQVERMTFDPKSLELSQMHHAPQERFASVIGIPGIVLGWNLEGAGKYKNMEEAQDEATEGYLQPLWDYMGEEYTIQLLPDFEGENPQRVVKCDTSKVAALQDDVDQLSLRYREELKAGGITINQFLQLTGKQPEDGLDIYLIPNRTLPMTADSMRQLANDPTQLAGAMPSETLLGVPSDSPDQAKSLPNGSPDKYDLRKMKRNWLRHAPKDAHGAL